MNREGGVGGRRGHMSVFGQRWACSERARDNYARVIVAAGSGP